MATTVWISQVKRDSSLGDNSGLRCKLFDEDWSRATRIQPLPSKAYMDGVRRNDADYALDRRSFPEAIAVWDCKRFARSRDFFWVNGFVAVKGRLAEILLRYNFGDGGLIPLTVYQEDLRTLEPGSFFLVNFGARKDSLIGDESRSIEELYIDPETGRQVWTVADAVKDGDIAMTQAALGGADIWNEAGLRSAIFMTDAVVTEIVAARLKIDFQLARCRIVGVTRS